MSSPYWKRVSLSRLRSPHKGDSGRIEAALNASLVSVRRQDINYLVDVQLAVNMLTMGGVEAKIVDDVYLVAWEVGTPWYSYHKVLNELLVLRLGNGSSFQAVADFLDDLADEHDVALTTVGGALTRLPKALARLYSRHGYVDEGKPTLTKRR